METKDLVIKALKDSEKPLKTAEIASASGLDKDEVGKILKTLKKEEIIFSPKNCYYSLK